MMQLQLKRSSTVWGVILFGLLNVNHGYDNVSSWECLCAHLMASVFKCLTLADVTVCRVTIQFVHFQSPVLVATAAAWLIGCFSCRKGRGVLVSGVGDELPRRHVLVWSEWWVYGFVFRFLFIHAHLIFEYLFVVKVVQIIITQIDLAFLWSLQSTLVYTQSFALLNAFFRCSVPRWDVVSVNFFTVKSF